MTEQEEADPTGVGVGASNPFENGGGDPDLSGGGVSLVPEDPSGRCRLDGIAFSCASLGRMIAMEAVVLAPVESFRALRFKDQENRVRAVLGRYDPAYGAYLPVGVSGLSAGVVGDAVIYNFRFGDGATALGWAAYSPQAGAANFAPGAQSPAKQNPVQPPPDVVGIRSELKKIVIEPALPHNSTKDA